MDVSSPLLLYSTPQPGNWTAILGRHVHIVCILWNPAAQFIPLIYTKCAICTSVCSLVPETVSGCLIPSNLVLNTPTKALGSHTWQACAHCPCTVHCNPAAQFIPLTYTMCNLHISLQPCAGDCESMSHPL